MKNKTKLLKAALITAALAVICVMALNNSNPGLLFNGIFLGALSDGEDNAGTAVLAVSNPITINTPDDLINYSNAYNSNPSEYQNIDVSIAITSGDLSNLNGFSSIGTSDYPFAASITIPSSTDLNLTLDKPLFANISDSAKIVDDKGNPKSIKITRSGSANSALFAENVIHKVASVPAKWNIDIVSSDSSENISFSSVIGTLEENAAVELSISIDENADFSVVSSGNAGLACATMNSGSSLSVAITGENTSYSVTSTGGNAGGLVGTLMSGSSFTLTSNSSISSSVSASGYAGGLIGYVEESATVNIGSGSSVSGTISGNSGTGGVFGYYKNTTDNTFNMDFSVNCTLNGVNSGGIFGVLENSGNITISQSGGSIACARTSQTANDFGGLVGVYSSENTSNSLTIKDITVSVDNSNGKMYYYGGVIGKVADDSYIKFENVNVSAYGCKNVTNSNFGGLVGYIDKAFIDAKNITVNTNGEYYGGGIIGYMNGGVLRLDGTTNLSGTKAAKGGQIVGTRGNYTLVYAKPDWKFIRSSQPAAFDDIGGWGSVLRLGLSLSESDIFTVNETAHTVTIKSATTTINSLADYAKLALNIQLNNGTSYGTLYFEDTTNKSSVLLGSNITLNYDLKLSGTGLTGLTRDDGKSAGGGNTVYTGTFNGNSHTITLATGEPYGYRGNDSTPITADDKTDGNGIIHRHYYNALFAQTGNGVQFKNVTINGVVNVSYKESSSYYLSGLAGAHKNGAVTIENVNVYEKLRLSGTGGGYNFAGGIIGAVVGDSKPVITISDCIISPEIIYEDSRNNKFICGGAFGEIASNVSFSLTAENVTIGAKVTNNSTTNNDMTKKAGGFIGNISNYSGTAISSNRTVSIENMTFDGAEITTTQRGGLLGEFWNNVNVTIGSETEKGITVRNSTVKQTGNTGFGGLVMAATGYWKVYDISIESITVEGSSASSFGMFINKGVHIDYSKTFALYLEFAKENAYKITAADLSKLNASAVYDDIIATCSDNTTNTASVLQNGKCAVVSIHTSGGVLKMDGTNCNTYQNQTSINKENPYSRYYYNLDVLRAKDTSQLTSPEKLLLWSLNKYAYSNIKQYFHNAFGNTIPAGSYNMTGYSYYPIDLPENTTIASGSTFTFCNDKIENSENGTGNSDSFARKTTGDPSQHYLMHCGLFRNANKNLTLNNSITFRGTIGGDTNYCGALLCGTIAGSSDSTVVVTVNGIVLDGIKVNGDTSAAGYAPLLINRVDSFSELSLSNVSTTAGYGTSGTAIAATSLIGDVGNSEGNSSDIKLKFSNLTLDGRKSAVSDAAANSALNAAYNTDRSIFSKAILLNSFKYKAGSNCSGSYNFRYEEDWNNDNTAKHHVAYGKEISDTKEYLENSISMQLFYLKSGYYVNPTASNSAVAYSFTEFLPYVAASYSTAENLHEIKVNHFVIADLDSGCGTYNDPYIITSGKQLELVDKILNSGLGSSEDETIINYCADNYKVWCANKNSHAVLKWNAASGKFESENGSVKKTLAEMQAALSTAYYMINADIKITSADYTGIGKKVPFKGVIIGNNGSKTIENQSVNPLIFQSAGAVVKDITVKVSADFTGKFNDNANSKYETDGGTAAFYGGVIGIVNGGDNIIDKVGVVFTNAGTINIKNGNSYGNKAIGGYIGVVRYGGVIFRNMDSVPENNRQGITKSANSMFNSTGDFKDSNGKILLYCNPIIGRVIDGYAVTEANSFNGEEANVTMKNGTKNYSIADISKNAERIAFSGFANPEGKSSIISGTVSVTNAQQLFLLGCISMSGAGSADVSGNYPEITVDSKKVGKYSYGTGKMTRLAEYTDVGTTNTKENTADFNLAKTDSFAQNNVPNIIYKYTAESVTYSGGTISYPAKCITNDSFVFNIELTQGTYNMPDGFRGIGSMNNSATNLIMYINGIKGNNSTIVLNMNFYMYKNTYEKYYVNDNNNLNTFRNYKVGLGLFNTLVQNKSTHTPTGFETDTSGKYSVSGLTFRGTVNHEVYDFNNNNNFTSGYNSDSYFSVAGALAGAVVNSNLIIDDVNMSDLNVNARYVSGGLIGSVTGSGSDIKVRITDFGADNLTVGGGVLSGGLIAYVRDTIFEANGNTNGTSHANFNNIAVSSKTNPKGFHDDVGIGGLIGTIHSQNTGAAYSATIKNIDFNGNNSVIDNGNNSFLGGVVGCCGDRDKSMEFLTISNITFNGAINIDGHIPSSTYCGGVFGTVKKSIKNVVIENVQLIGEEGSSIVCGRSQAGGIVGLVIANVSLNNCLLENYTVKATETNPDVEGVGGFVAKAENGKIVSIRNSKLSNCILQCNVKMQVGGVVGSVVDKAKVFGSNIVIYDVSITNTSGGTLSSGISGDIAGLINAGCELKLVGVSVKKQDSGIYIGKDIGTNSGTAYIIYSDHKGACLGNTPNTNASTINNGQNVVGMGAYPYATVNPKKDIDNTQFLTGDGVDKSAIDAIIADFDSLNGYKNVKAEYDDKFSKYVSKLSSFNEKTGAAIPGDIPILVINDSYFKNVTEMLNSYIHILTNDVYVSNYANADSSICNVEIIPLRLNEESGVFETKAEYAKTLEYKNGNFRMTDLDYDSNYKQFSLIDIQYFDPSAAGKIAYHLYIPVYVEKMLNFDFKAAVLSGTTYKTDIYTPGHPVLENYGTPVTAYITYSYKRTAEEWQDAINSGENLLSGYGKSVLLKSNNDLPPDTMLVLVDRNNNCMAYYSTVGEAFSSSDKKLDFSRFAAADTTQFVPVNFCELLSKSATVTAAADINGNLLKCTEEDLDKAVFRIGEEYYRKKTDSDTDTSLLYSVQFTAKPGMTDSSGIVKVEEDYYISFFTKADNSAPMRNITVSCSRRLGDTDMTPSHLDNESSVHVILGNLYDQTFSFGSTGSEVINDSNRALYAEMETTISLKPENAGEVKPYLNDDSIHLYHGFIIEVTRTDETATEKGIKGVPWVSGTYKIGNTEYPQNFSNPDSVIILTSGDSQTDIKNYLITDGTVTVSCNNLVISYSDEESIIAQFPERKNDGETYGVTLSANSNLAYVQGNIAHSKMSESRNDGSNKSYYRENIAVATLSYNIPLNSHKEMTKLGINGRETNEKITAIGYYNVLNIPEATLSNAAKVKFTLSLYQKNNEGNYIAVPINEYLEDIALYDKNDTAKAFTENNGSYEFLFDKENELNYEAGSFKVVSSYSVITGARFESEGKLYSNYKVQLTAMLLDQNGLPIENSGCSDYIIYTNAKIYSNLLSVG